jgi:4-amino-4-deoxy-L-arabinose transferase-like glycosyltransferase
MLAVRQIVAVRPRLVVPAAGSNAALLALISATTLLRLIWSFALEASNDEAYNFLYTVYPDWSQFDHPPMTMLVERLGIALFGGTITPLSLRIGFVLLGAASTWLMARWTERLFDDPCAGFYAALGLNFTAYFTIKAGSFALPDGPMSFFTIATLWALTEAISKPPRIGPWLLVGVCWALAMTSKYHAVFLPAAALLFIAVTPTARCHLRSAGPYVAAMIGLAGLVPTLLWNANHEWASFGFQGGRAVGFGFRPLKLLSYLGEQSLHWFPWIWIALHIVLVKGLRHWRTRSESERLLLCQAAVPLGFFLAIATIKGAMAHWALIGFLPLYPLLGQAWASDAIARPAWLARWHRFMAAATVALVAAILIVVRLFTDEWSASGHLAFESGGVVPALCFRADDARGFAFWSRPEDWLGHDGLLVDVKNNPQLLEHYAPYFRSIELLTSFPMTRGGQPMLTVRVYLCTGLIEPYPFRSHR